LAVKVVVGRKGCIIIPKSIRELVGIKEGDVLTLTVENGRVVLEPGEEGQPVRGGQEAQGARGEREKVR